MFCGCRRKTGSSKLWLVPFPAHQEHWVRPPASLEQGVRSGRLLADSAPLDPLLGAHAVVWQASNTNISDFHARFHDDLAAALF